LINASQKQKLAEKGRNKVVVLWPTYHDYWQFSLFLNVDIGKVYGGWRHYHLQGFEEHFSL